MGCNLIFVLRSFRTIAFATSYRGSRTKQQYGRKIVIIKDNCGGILLFQATSSDFLYRSGEIQHKISIDYRDIIPIHPNIIPIRSRSFSIAMVICFFRQKHSVMCTVLPFHTMLVRAPHMPLQLTSTKSFAFCIHTLIICGRQPIVARQPPAPKTLRKGRVLSFLDVKLVFITRYTHHGSNFIRVLKYNGNYTSPLGQKYTSACLRTYTRLMLVRYRVDISCLPITSLDIKACSGTRSTRLPCPASPPRYCCTARSSRCPPDHRSRPR